MPFVYIFIHYAQKNGVYIRSTTWALSVVLLMHCIMYVISGRKSLKSSVGDLHFTACWGGQTFRLLSSDCAVELDDFFCQNYFLAADMRLAPCCICWCITSCFCLFSYNHRSKDYFAFFSCESSCVCSCVSVCLCGESVSRLFCWL